MCALNGVGLQSLVSNAAMQTSISSATKGWVNPETIGGNHVCAKVHVPRVHGPVCFLYPGCGQKSSDDAPPHPHSCNDERINDLSTA